MRRELNPSRLKRARLLRGLTTTDLGKLVGVTRQSISQYETGRQNPATDTLVRISNILNVPWGFFHEDDHIDIKLRHVFYRSLSSTRKFDIEVQNERLRVLSELYHVIAKDIRFPSLSIDHEKFYGMNPEEAAKQLRIEWDLGIAPIKNMVTLLERNGFVLSSTKTNGKAIDAFGGGHTFEDEDYYFIILADDKASAVRRQFDVAHELGHALLHDWDIDWNELEVEEHKKLEDEANKFASAFLLPPESFRVDLDYSIKLDYFVELKKKWKVSVAAMIMRAKAIDAISQNQFTYLFRQLSTRGWRKREPLDDLIKMANPALLAKAVEMLIVNDRYTSNSFVRNVSEYGLTLNYKDIEQILNLKEDMLKPSQDDIAEIIDLKSRLK